MSQQINLFNPVFMNQRKYFSMVTMLQMLGLIVLGATLVYAYSWYQVKSLTILLDETSKRYVAEQAKLNRYTTERSPQESSQLLENQVQMEEARLAAQNEIIEKLKSGEIGNATGHSEYMRAFARQAVHGLWLKSININEDATQMKITGAVLSPELLPIYIHKLNQEQAMRGKLFSSLSMQRGGNDAGYVEFNLQSTDAGKANK